ncbi:MAG: tetratricopeptide repeat protein [Dehalococcoidia bacterium]
MEQKRTLAPWKPLYLLGGLVALVIAVGSCGVVLFALSSTEVDSEPLPDPLPRNAEDFLFRGIDFGDDGEYELAIQDFTEAIQLNPKLVRAYYNRGITLNRMQRYRDAIKDFTIAIVLDPDYSPAYANRALSYTLIGKDAEAGADIERAVELGKDRQVLEERIEGARLSR